MDFAINIDKFNLANLVGDVLDKIIEFQIFFTFSKLYLKVKQHSFWPWENNGLHHEHWQALPGQLGGEGDEQDHGVTC